jgi:hypothetical protein
MPQDTLSNTKVPVEKLRWRMDPARLIFETTNSLKPLEQIIGQDRGVAAFRFGMSMDKPGYNVFVTGKTAGKKGLDGSYSEETINFRVDEKLKQLAEGLKKFAGGANAESRKD